MRTDWEMLERIRNSASRAELARLLGRAVNRMGYQWHVLALRPRAMGGPRVPTTILHDVPAAWAEHRYAGFDARLDPRRDATIAHVTQALPPTSWDVSGKVLTTFPLIQEAAKPMLLEAGTYGLRSGVVAPILRPSNEWAFFSAITDSESQARGLIPTIADVYLLGTFAVTALERLDGQQAPCALLSSREREVLRWSAIGKTAWEIGRILGVSERTAHFHLQRAARKLKVTGSRAAVAQALARRLIDL